MYILKNWYIENNNAFGNVIGNPKFIEGLSIHTSKIQDIKIDEEKEEAIIITRNSEYHCPLDSCKFNWLESKHPMIDKIKEFESKIHEKYEFELPEENIVLIEFDNTEYKVHRMVARYNGELYFMDEPYIHLGMVQDSVLLRLGHNKGFFVDIRFFPYSDSIEFYTWHTDFNVILKNVSSKPFVIKDGIVKDKEKIENKCIELQPNESIKVNKDGEIIKE